METALFTVGQPGQLIAGRYRLERVLARGGHGVVFVAEQLATEAKVALKILSPALLDSDEMRRRFELEAKVAGRVGSDFIVRVLDAGVDPATGFAFLAMELLEGESLAQTVERHGPLSPLEAASCILQIAQGLDKAHGHTTREGEAAPIIHRDLKPENLFLAQRDDGERITKILDFGIAKVVHPSGVNSRTIQGSPLYVAYEQLTGGTLSARTDVWALGLVAFFLLTGQSYWLSAQNAEIDVAAVISEVAHVPIVSPTERAAELGIAVTWPAAFDSWFLRCVHRTPDKRFESAGEAGEVLFQALVGGGISTPDAVVSLRRAPRHRSRALVLSAAGLALAVGLALVSLPWTAAQSAHASPLKSRGVAAVASLASDAQAVASRAAPVKEAQPVASAKTDVPRTDDATASRKSLRPVARRAPATAAPTPNPPARPPVEWVMGSPLYSDR